MRILTKLKITEVSSVDRGAGEGVQIVLRKHDQGDNASIIDKSMDALAESVCSIIADDNVDKAAAMTKTFEQFSDYLKVNVVKAAVSDPLRGDREEDTDKKLSAALDEIVAEMIVARPSLHPQHARRWLLGTEAGRDLLAQHTTKKREPPMLDVNKLIPIVEEALLSRAPNAKEFAKLYENDVSFRRDWQVITEAKMNLAKGMATLEPTSTEVGNTSVSDDSAEEAVRLLREMATKNGRSFESEFADPTNRKLAMRTYTARPNASSTSGSELQKRDLTPPPTGRDPNWHSSAR
jgi:hypothetical protein